ncbi:unnamed protein product [Caenorhabditis auriculariae]|uniref:Transmembrane protein 216 n=1 Tax=Caenorhabditis auriculariae TaxID=2777116 RepID=A0A8S1HTL1_9PELO|nr:unnamed protein product [Caenorhabditis auriculariae]
MISTVRSSLSFQILVHCHKTYSVIFFTAIVLLYFYKGAVLPYQNYVRVMEFFILLPFAPIEALRLSWGTRGNVLESFTFVFFSLLLAVPILVICIYLSFFQNYVLLLEAILTYIQGIAVIVEVLLSLALCVSFSGSSTAPSTVSS